MATEQFRDWSPKGDIKIKYKDGHGVGQYWTTSQETLLNDILGIIEDFMNQKITLTNRQLYYQLVASELIPNATEIYKRICEFLTDARYGGYIDWDAIEDRGRPRQMHAEWDNVKDFVNDAIQSYRLRRWSDQEYYVELYTEKQSSESILAPIADRYHISFSYNKGYSGAAPFYDLSKRIFRKISGGKDVVLLYAGDHDPSGIDMVRDIKERITEFLTKGDDGYDVSAVEMFFHVVPLALNMEQIRQYNPPPNPAKISDPRARKYVEQFGNVSWELDALRPEVLTDIIERGIQRFMDVYKYNSWIEKEKPDKQRLQDFADSLVNGDTETTEDTPDENPGSGSSEEK